MQIATADWCICTVPFSVLSQIKTKVESGRQMMGSPPGGGYLSGILCARPVSSLADEPFAEDDGELGFGLEPLARQSFPILGGMVQDQI